MKTKIICPICGKPAKRIKQWYRDDQRTMPLSTEYIHRIKKTVFGDMVWQQVTQSCQQEHILPTPVLSESEVSGQA